ncbi:MAG: putative Ig domain-containing protein [Pseudomonadota bacterium]|jgi:Fibronectin type III domain.
MTPPLTAPPEDSTNRAPIVSGTAPTKVTVGEAYVFQPQASDPDNDVVTFTIANKPAWANFDPKTGKLWGTPTAENVGTYSAIEIAATDGSSVTALPPFDLTVTAVAGVPPKAVTVAWDAPTQNEDGSPLVDLQGYKIYYGRQSQKYETTITVDNPGLTRYVLENLAPGTYFVAVTAYNKSGVESAFSEELRATLN